MAYFVLECLTGPNGATATFNPYDGFQESWFLGQSFTTPPPTPIELVWNADTKDGKRVALYDAGPPVLMTKSLLAALHDAGVDNLDEYPVVIRSERGEPDCNDYMAVNIIGAIAAANMEESTTADDGSGMIDMTFDSLAIDEHKAEGQLLFRLANSVSAIIIHETVVKHLNAHGGFGLTFTAPEDFIQL